MSDLKFDLQLLHQLRDDLDAVVAEFNGAEAFSKDVGDATGHDALGQHVNDFATKWNAKRTAMVEAVTSLRDKIGAITDGFTQVDEGLAQALEDSAPTTKPAVNIPL